MGAFERGGRFAYREYFRPRKVNKLAASFSKNKLFISLSGKRANRLEIVHRPIILIKTLHYTIYYYNGQGENFHEPSSYRVPTHARTSQSADNNTFVHEGIESYEWQCARAPPPSIRRCIHKYDM